MQNVHTNWTQGKACDPKDGPYVQTYKWKEKVAIHGVAIGNW